jgi:hypothetical protein
MPKPANAESICLRRRTTRTFSNDNVRSQHGLTDEMRASGQIHGVAQGRCDETPFPCLGERGAGSYRPCRPECRPTPVARTVFLSAARWLIIQASKSYFGLCLTNTGAAHASTAENFGSTAPNVGSLPASPDRPLRLRNNRRDKTWRRVSSRIEIALPPTRRGGRERFSRPGDGGTREYPTYQRRPTSIHRPLRVDGGLDGMLAIVSQSFRAAAAAALGEAPPLRTGATPTGRGR